MNFVRTLLRILSVASVFAVWAVWLSGCGGNDNRGGGGWIVSNTCTSAEECKSKPMPDGKTWMTENLNIETADSRCYENSPDSCAKYGRLYPWDAAVTACPSGWHLPTRAEWGALAKAAGGTGDYGASGTAGRALKSASGWYSNGNGTDQYGFSAMPGDYLFSAGFSTMPLRYGYWWTATEDGGSNAYFRDMYYLNDDVHEDGDDKSNAFSVRCVAD